MYTFMPKQGIKDGISLRVIDTGDLVEGILGEGAFHRRIASSC